MPPAAQVSTYNRGTVPPIDEFGDGGELPDPFVHEGVPGRILSSGQVRLWFANGLVVSVSSDYEMRVSGSLSRAVDALVLANGAVPGVPDIGAGQSAGRELSSIGEIALDD